MEFMKGVIDYGLIGFLLLLSVVAVAIAIERWLVYRKVDVRRFRDREELEILLTTRLHIIGTIASNAPYLGLLGTVLGIMLTFYTMGAEGFMDTKKTMVGLALALKATAMGLLVAIPAVTLYNLLLRRVKVLLLRWEMAASEAEGKTPATGAPAAPDVPAWVARNRGTVVSSQSGSQSGVSGR